MSSLLQNNITNLQELLEAVNALPEATIAAENLDEEISTQETLISEQDAKIAELAEILAGKANGGSSEYDTCTVNISGPMIIPKIVYLTVANNMIDYKIEYSSSSFNITCLCNSFIVVLFNGFYGELLNKATFICQLSDYVKIYHITAKKGETANIDVYHSGG